jgi:heme A synthase
MAKQATCSLTPTALLAYGTTLLAFVVVVLGAYTRLTNSGLGCPDWPGCYGQLVPQMDATNPLINTAKAWTEMIHRYLAGSLGIVLSLKTNQLSKNSLKYSRLPQVVWLFFKHYWVCGRSHSSYFQRL